MEPSQEELLNAYTAVQRKKQYNTEYMKRFRKEHPEEWNKQQRERYARRRAAAKDAELKDIPMSSTTSNVKTKDEETG